jgi:hypothetical protein
MLETTVKTAIAITIRLVLAIIMGLLLPLLVAALASLSDSSEFGIVVSSTPFIIFTLILIGISFLSLLPEDEPSERVLAGYPDKNPIDLRKTRPIVSEKAFIDAISTEEYKKIAREFHENPDSFEKE